MENLNDSALDKLWNEYAEIFDGFDDLRLARWLSQTLAQLYGGCWRMSHPLVAAYRVAAIVGHRRQIWLKRLVNLPSGYTETQCCHSPSMPIVTRDVIELGLVCAHCLGSITKFDDLPFNVQPILKAWAEEYNKLHHVAHRNLEHTKLDDNYELSTENARLQASALLGELGKNIAPELLKYYPLIIWEDQDECLGINPEDIALK